MCDKCKKTKSKNLNILLISTEIVGKKNYINTWVQITFFPKKSVIHNRSVGASCFRQNSVNSIQSQIFLHFFNGQK